MKPLTLWLSLVLVITTLSFTLLPRQTSGIMNPTANDPLIVLVKYKTQPDKASQALSSLKALLGKVKQEPNYVSITLHVDPADPSNILLYEQWSSEAYYKGDHMNTPHLQQFMKEARAFLAGPPDISFWRVDP